MWIEVESLDLVVVEGEAREHIAAPEFLLRRFSFLERFLPLGLLQPALQSRCGDGHNSDVHALVLRAATLKEP